MKDHEKRIANLEKVYNDHERRIINLESKFGLIVNNLEKILMKLPKHPIINIICYVGTGLGIAFLIVLIAAEVIA